MPILYTVELVNNSGASGKVYNVFSAKATIEGGGNTASTTMSVVWFRSKTIGVGQRTLFKFDDSVYGFLGSKDGGTIYPQGSQKVIVGSDRAEGSILLLDRSSSFSVIDADDDITIPGTKQFKIATNSGLIPDSEVIGIARGKHTGAGIVPAPTDVVDLKASVTYSITTSKAVYVKATSFTEGTVQTAPDDNDKKAVKVEFTGQMKKAVVTEDSKGDFTVTYSRGD